MIIINKKVLKMIIFDYKMIGSEKNVTTDCTIIQNIGSEKYAT